MKGCVSATKGVKVGTTEEENPPTLVRSRSWLCGSVALWLCGSVALCLKSIGIRKNQLSTHLL